MKKWFSLLLALVMLMSMAGGALAEAEEEFKLPIVDEPFTITIWAPAGDVVYKTMSNLGESAFYQEMEKRTGILHDAHAVAARLRLAAELSGHGGQRRYQGRMEAFAHHL